VLANGADPFVPPPFVGLEGVWGTREATAMKAVPRSLIVVGGGAAGTELAQAVRRFGGAVTLIEGSSHLLARDAAPLGDALGEVLRRDGIELILGAHVTAATRRDGDFVVELDNGTTVRGEKLLICTGRRPRVADIGLETVGIDPDPRGVHVDAFLRA